MAYLVKDVPCKQQSSVLLNERMDAAHKFLDSFMLC